MSSGHTITICDINCTKFLGITIGTLLTATHKLASNSMKQKILSYLQNIDNCSIRGEYTVWILKNFLTSILHFHIAVERLSVSTITAAQSSILKFVKRWLSLTCNCMPGTVFHPGVLDLPYLLHFQNSGKLSYVFATEHSVDLMIVELCLTSVPQGVSDDVFDALSAAKSSVASIYSATVKRLMLVTICISLTLVSGISNLNLCLFKINS